MSPTFLQIECLLILNRKLFLVTMDVGYIVSTLCGTLLGSLIVRKYGDNAVSKETKLFVVAVAVVVLGFDLC